MRDTTRMLGALTALFIAGNLTGNLTLPAWAQSADKTTGVRLDRMQTDLVRKVMPAVVGLTCSAEPGLRYYGTGVVVDPRGWVLTNVSVIPPHGTEIKVYFVGGIVRDAKILEYDVGTESILLAITNPEKGIRDGGGFPSVEIADSDKARVGHRVYTFGNPFSIIETESQVAVAAGAISGIGKLTDNAEEHNQSSYHGPVIETDAAVNPGSDGGPLLDASGRLLGVMSLGIQRERLLGLCIPSSHIARKLTRLAKHKLADPPAQQISARGAVLGQHARRLAKSVVWLEVDRAVPEKTFQVPTEEEYQKLAQQRGYNPSQLNMLKIQHRLRKLMERPPGVVTGLAIEGGKYVLTSAFNIGHNLAEKPPLRSPLPRLLRKVTVHAQGMKGTLEARLVARHLPYDLALLEVVGGTLPHAATFGSAEKMVEGFSVAILGRHRGMKRVTMTEGIISATRRNHNLVKVLQTDALINYANLGGPVIGLDGAVVGLSTFLNPEAGFGLNSGVGLFTDAARITAVLPGLKAGKSTSTPVLPFLGVQGWEERSIGGAYVAAVYGGSAARAAGVKPGDLIISVDGKPVSEWSDLIRSITSKAVGQVIEFEVQRGDDKIKLKAKLKQRPAR